MTTNVIQSDEAEFPTLWARRTHNNDSQVVTNPTTSNTGILQIFVFLRKKIELLRPEKRQKAWKKYFRRQAEVLCQAQEEILQGD